MVSSSIASSGSIICNGDIDAPLAGIWRRILNRRGASRFDCREAAKDAGHEMLGEGFRREERDIAISKERRLHRSIVLSKGFPHRLDRSFKAQMYKIYERR